MKLKKIISGGQVGADQKGVEEAAKRGIKTGGTMPGGWRTDQGPMKEWGLKHGLRVHLSSAYPPRTKQNVRDADATVWFGYVSPGYVCTRSAAETYGKLDHFYENPTPEGFREICEMYEIVNIAGNRNTTHPDVDAMVERAFTGLDNKE